MQTLPGQFSAFNSKGSKAVDFALAISGWPTIYTMFASGAVPSTGSADGTTLNQANGFTTLRAWMNAPKIAGGSVKSRPEEGGATLGQLDVEILDKQVAGVRSITDLLSRDAYVSGNKSGNTYTLNANATRTDTSLTLVSTAGITAGDVIHVSQEAIKVGTVASGTSLTGCTRGFRFTDAVAHTSGVKIYSFLPSLFQRPAYLYKGYQQITLDNWARHGWGPIVDDGKAGALVSLTVMTQAWNAFRLGLFVSPFTGGGAVTTIPISGNLLNPALQGEFTSIAVNVNAAAAAASLVPSSGGYLAIVDGEFMAVRGAS